MLPDTIRVSVKLEKDCEAEAFLASLEQLLERPVRPVRFVKSARVLSLRLKNGELNKLRDLPGVLRADPEERRDLPPQPKKPKGARS